MTVIGDVRRFDLKYNFEVYVMGVADASFASCSEPSVSVGEAQLWQGGSLIPIKEPARLTFNDITLERGMSRDTGIWNWFKSFNNAAAVGGTFGQGAAMPGVNSATTYKAHTQIVQKDRSGFAIEQIQLFNSFPKEVSLGDFSNDADEFRMERVVLGYDWFDRVPLSPT